MITNARMKNLINDLFLYQDSDATLQLNQLLMVLNPIIKNVQGCLIIDNNNEIEAEKVNFERLLKIHGDATCYEASNNEIRINDFVDGDSIDVKGILTLGFNILEVWSNRLKRDYPDGKFCLIITCENESVTLRFHQIRDDESGWLAEDLEQYTDAVAYTTI